jgi:hypothetical protein
MRICVDRRPRRQLINRIPALLKRRADPSTGDMFRVLGFSADEGEHLLLRADC